MRSGFCYTDFQFDPAVDMVSSLGHRIGKPPDHIIRCQIKPIADPLIQVEDVDEIANADSGLIASW